LKLFIIILFFQFSASFFCHAQSLSYSDLDTYQLVSNKKTIISKEKYFITKWELGNAAELNKDSAIKSSFKDTTLFTGMSALNSEGKLYLCYIEGKTYDSKGRISTYFKSEDVDANNFLSSFERRTYTFNSNDQIIEERIAYCYDSSRIDFRKFKVSISGDSIIAQKVQIKLFNYNSFGNIVIEKIGTDNDADSLFDSVQIILTTYNGDNELIFRQIFSEEFPFDGIADKIRRIKYKN